MDGLGSRSLALMMKSRKTNWITALSWAVLLLLPAGVMPERAGAQGSEPIREPILAGTWYPGNAKDLRTTIDAFLSRAEPPAGAARPLGIVAPHAGHVYSGQVAARAYRLLMGSDFQRVILIGPSHHARFRGVSVDLHAGYKTPLGVLPVDRVFAEGLLRADPFVDRIPQAHAREHSLEIQVPFLQAVLPHASIVPLIMGQQDLAACERLASLLARVIGPDRRTLILASSDLSHFHPDGRARELDGEFIRHVKAYDPRGLARSIAEGKCEACGGGPVVAAMLACKALGADRAVQLGYATSGDATGDRTRVVGYFSGAFVGIDH